MKRMFSSLIPPAFNSSTTIRYDLPSPENVRLAVYDINGRLVNELMNVRMPAGRHVVELDASGLAAGVYFVILETRLASKSGHPLPEKMIQKVVVVK